MHDVVSPVFHLFLKNNLRANADMKYAQHQRIHLDKTFCALSRIFGNPLALLANYLCVFALGFQSSCKSGGSQPRGDDRKQSMIYLCWSRRSRVLLLFLVSCCVLCRFLPGDFFFVTELNVLAVRPCLICWRKGADLVPASVCLLGR